MGTSAPFPGPGNNTPLLPDWADDYFDDGPDPAEGAPEPGDAPDQEPSVPPEGPNLPLPAPPEPYRFRSPRNNFTRFVVSGGTNTNALGRALQGYVRRGNGGSTTAARRMGASRLATSNLVSVLHDIQRLGVDEVLRQISLEHLTGRSPKDVLIALTDVICEPGGSVDEAIARDAYVETVIELTELGENLDNITEDQVEIITIGFIARSITNRVINDIGQSLDIRTVSGDQANYLVRFAFDFILGAVQDRLRDELRTTRGLQSATVRRTISSLYRIAFLVVESEAEGLI